MFGLSPMYFGVYFFVTALIILGVTLFLKKKLVGKDREFYKVLLVLCIPIIVQNFISTSVNVIDTVMISSLGEESIAAVGVANQVFFLFNMGLIGLTGATGLFISQFYGSNDRKSIKKVMGLSTILCVGFSFIFFVLAFFFPELIIGIFSTDPKVVELANYNGIPHLLIPVVTDPKKAANALNWAVTEMNRRYKLFADAQVKDVTSYNEKAEEKLPKIVIIIDELADLMMASANDVEDYICRLAQMARAAGMHLIVATQRPSVDVITGVIKANIPSRIAFAVSSQTDSRTILDMGGAEKLLGKGDMLFYPLGAAKPVRLQGAFISESESEKVIDFVKSQVKDGIKYEEDIIETISKVNTSKGSDEDEFLSEAIEFVVESGQASASMLQRRFKIGFNRAARLIDSMEERGIIGASEGSKPRKVLISKQDLQNLEGE